MSTKAVDPRGIDPTCKEALVDSLLNNLGARVSGAGDYYRIIYGARPSGTLVSGFIVPVSPDKRHADEEADPMQISAHGLDFQISAEALKQRILVKLTGSVYVRVLPNERDVMPGGILRPVFPLQPEAKHELRKRVYDALDVLRAELGLQRKDEFRNPQWAKRSLEVRRRIHAEMGLTIDVPQTTEEEVPDEGSDASEEEEGEGSLLEAVPTDPSLTELATPPRADSNLLFRDIPPLDKWLRLDLQLPVFEFTAATAAEDAAAATAALNASIAAQLLAWYESNDPDFSGRMWGYRQGCRVRPTDLANWRHFLEMTRASDSRPVVPAFDIRWKVGVVSDPIDPERLSVHLAVENHTERPNRHRYRELECALFRVSVSADLPQGILRKMTLDRVKPSYRYNRYLRYPALGFNGAVKHELTEAGDHLTTTWAPRYVLPRVLPKDFDLDLRFASLALPTGIAGLSPLIEYFKTWLSSAKETPADAGLEGPNAQQQVLRERRQLALDVASWEAELNGIERGLSILQESASHWSKPGPQDDARAIPFEAWLALNRSMQQVGGKKYDSWRLFQLAFIVSMIPTFATRIPEFHSHYKGEVERHANAATLLYFPTGGGKSEAFLGLLLYILFADRLRAKHRGVSALMRYPLRLLTLQQARRTMAVLAAGELERRRRGIPGDPFSLGFWVGGTNTPNWHGEDSQIPALSKSPLSEEASILDKPPYSNYRKQWLKLEQCPYCKSKFPVALRIVSGGGSKLLGHFCTAPTEVCPWNALHGTSPTPLPFYIVDEDIYALAPSVLLGTVDKLAVIGQSYRTIRHVFGMFGLAPFRNPVTGRLHTPMSQDDWSEAVSKGYERMFPAYADGSKAFYDPFPSLLVQDEAHLLDESLGTFAGLFETAFEAALEGLSSILGNQICREPGGRRRRIKVIAATATVSEPQRQMRNLYQRDDTLQFPFPGPDLYTSFYSEPKLPDPRLPRNHARLALEDIELRSHGARVYTAILTNGHRHTVAMASILGHYHLHITELYEQLRSGSSEQHDLARQTIATWLSQSPNEPVFQDALRAASPGELLSLIDLHRIALTYVTNKKGGDQVIDTERVQFDVLHRRAGMVGQDLQTRLISGGVTASDIQAVVREAESRVRPGDEFPDLKDTLRSIIATSAVSHGVDVEELNAMFFAGLPSDIAEYIQASSRVGRTHSGFSLLVPVPQRHRDRFVTEIFDIFHRFLERMVLPAAVDRWAEKAIRRVIPSVLQEYLCGVSRITEIAAATGPAKGTVRDFQRTSDVRTYLQEPEKLEALTEFVVEALGLGLRPPPEGEAYYRTLVTKELARYRKAMNERQRQNSDFKEFFKDLDRTLQPMTSLRDVDQVGWIHESYRDVEWKKVREGETAVAMDFIRRGIGRELDDYEAD